ISKGAKRISRRWSFVSDLFHRVILADAPLVTTSPVDWRFERYRQRVFVGVLTFCSVLSLAFFISWVGNHSLLADVKTAALADQSDKLTLAELRNLDALRIQVERLRNGASWWLHFGLYSGNSVIEGARAAYFQRFHQLILA